MSMSSSRSGAFSSEINVTPMIDVLLVLLIIFMVIVPALPRGESARLPRTSNHSTGLLHPVVLEVLKQGRGVSFRMNQQSVTREELPGRLASIFAIRADRVLFLKGDDQLSFNQMADVMDIGHAAGIDTIGLMTPATQVAR